jgi:FkbM family methyltransferase
MKLKNVFLGIRWMCYPTKQQKLVKKYFADGGDYKFRFNYNLNENSIILDCGGYMGQWASDIYSRYRSKIFIFEPVKDFFDIIKDRFKDNQDIQYFQFGLGDSDRIDTITLSANGSSIFGDNSNREEMKMIDVKNWIKEYNIIKINLLKLNIEGGEYELLDRLIECDLIKIIDNIQVQFHDINKDSYLHVLKIRESLKNTHKSTYSYDFVWENWIKI